MRVMYPITKFGIADERRGIRAPNGGVSKGMVEGKRGMPISGEGAKWMTRDEEGRLKPKNEITKHPARFRRQESYHSKEGDKRNLVEIFAKGWSAAVGEGRE
jgi:hypothetical protein